MRRAMASLPSRRSRRRTSRRWPRPADHPRHLRLELEQHLQRALRDFRLIGRVGGEELAALDQVIDRGRHVVPIGPAPRKNGTSPAAMFFAPSPHVRSTAISLA